MKKSFVSLIVLMVSALGLLANAQEAEPVVQPEWDELDAGVWTNIPGSEGTICSNGTPYSFYARPAEEPSDKLLIHFQGGGACWMGANCDLSARPSYDPFVDESDDPTGNSGIGDFENPENPFSDYNIIFAPYCTGDVHIGSGIHTYESRGSDVEINHNGFVNATSVLDWTFDNVEAPSDVFVTGCSAGSIPSPLYTLWVAQQYPEARIIQLGDASGSYRNVTGALTEIFEKWGTFDILGEDFDDIAHEDLSFESFYTVAANLLPDVQFAQYNAAFDRTQTGFIILGGLASPNTLELLRANHDDIRAALDQDNFAAFTAGGSTHCITVTPDMYTFAADGVRFIDWLTALARGVPVGDVSCTGDCSSVEIIQP